MKQLDLVGDTPPPEPFRDAPNQRSEVAEEKARLLLELGRLTQRVPPLINSASVEKIRLWKEERAAAAKVAGSKRASRNEISAAINSMRKWW